MNILLTGATGFIGRGLVRTLNQRKEVSLAVALRSQGPSFCSATHVVGELSADTDWSAAVARQEVVIHAAARAHVVNDVASNALDEYRRVNLNGTLKLAKQAAAAGVKRFIFISSIGVNGNCTIKPFSAADHAMPAESYALSKWEAEQALWEVQEKTGMELVILRPPLVYGPNAPGNFGNLVRWLEKGWPLPLGAIQNKRSLIGVDNLVDLIVRCIDHPGAANQVFLASDGEDLSTTELLRGVGRAMGRPARLIPVPAGLLNFVAGLLGKKAVAQRLLGSLQVDISKTCELLEWRPPYTVEESLRRCFPKSH